AGMSDAAALPKLRGWSELLGGSQIAGRRNVTSSGGEAPVSGPDVFCDPSVAGGKGLPWPGDGGDASLPVAGICPGGACESVCWNIHCRERSRLAPADRR